MWSRFVIPAAVALLLTACAPSAALSPAGTTEAAAPVTEPVPAAPATARPAPILTCHSPRLDVLYRARWKCPDGHNELDRAQAEQMRQHLAQQLRPAAFSGTGAFTPPPVGTRIFTSNGGFYEILAVEGMTISVMNQAGSIFALFAGVYIPWIDADFDRTKLEALWPLEVGRSVEFVQVRNRESWRNQFRVAAAERIKTLAGEFDTYRIESVSEALGTAPNRFWISRRIWYAPTAGYIVKSDFEQRSGNPVADRPWELARVVRPLAAAR